MTQRLSIIVLALCSAILVAPTVSAAVLDQSAECAQAAVAKAKSIDPQNDKALLIKTYPRVKSYYQGKVFGESDSETCDVLTQAWSHMSTFSATKQASLTPGVLATAAESYGGIHITSNPSGATIYIDNRRWDGTTDSNAASRSGTKAVRLSLAGYEDGVGAVVVSEGQWSSFHRELKKK